MSYNPTNWQTGDTVTAEKLNKLEGGVENAQLPAVTSDDNGDVLTVVEGAWAKAAPSGDNVVILNETAVATKSFNDFVAYAVAGKTVFIVFTGEDAPNLPWFTFCWITAGGYDNNTNKYVVNATSVDAGTTSFNMTFVADTATEPMTMTE